MNKDIIHYIVPALRYRQMTDPYNHVLLCNSKYYATAEWGQGTWDDDKKPVTCLKCRAKLQLIWGQTIRPPRLHRRARNSRTKELWEDNLKRYALGQEIHGNLAID